MNDDQPTIRLQYHFRKTASGLDAWHVGRLIKISRDFPVLSIDPTKIAELYENHWYFQNTVTPSPQSIIEHIELIHACDLTYPIILDQQGRVMDGMHRVCKAVIDKVTEIPAVQFDVDPAPDYHNCDPQELPYDAPTFGGKA